MSAVNLVATSIVRGLKKIRWIKRKRLARLICNSAKGPLRGLGKGKLVCLRSFLQTIAKLKLT